MSLQNDSVYEKYLLWFVIFRSANLNKSLQLLIHLLFFHYLCCHQVLSQNIQTCERDYWQEQEHPVDPPYHADGL